MNFRDWGANWRQIKAEWRIIILMIIYMIAIGVGMVVRPENTVNRYLNGIIDLEPEFVGFVFIIMGTTLPLIFYITRSFFVALLWMSPVLMISVSLLLQIAGSPTAPIIHGVNLTFAMIFVAVLWSMARELRFWRRYGEDMATLVKEYEDTIDELTSESPSDEGENGG